MGNTVVQILISEDVNKLHTSVNSGMEKLGYWDKIKYEGKSKIYYLPNTTLWHVSKTSGQAIVAIKATSAMDW